MSSIRTDGSPKQVQSTAPTTPIEMEDLEPVDIMRETMAEMTRTWSYIHEAFSIVQEQTDQFLALPLESRVIPEEIQDIHNQIEIHSSKMEAERGGLKSSLEDTVKQEVAESIWSLSNGWPDLIREEAIAQVKEQVDLQITEHLPESLQQQVDETKRQVEGIKVSLQNSQARMSNSFIGSRDIDDPLSPILTLDGMRSPYYPHSARSLFAYDLASARALNTDYELTESDDLFANFQQFLRHIGTGVEIAASPR